MEKDETLFGMLIVTTVNGTCAYVCNGIWFLVYFDM